MRPFRLAAALTLAVCATSATGSTASYPASQADAAVAIDHVLLWGRSIDGITAAMAVRLGFQVKDGHDRGGEANRYVRFIDNSYIELVGMTRANPDLDPGALADQKLLKGRAGSVSTVLFSHRLEQLRTTLDALGWKPTPLFSGPKVANGRPGWRLFAFDTPPLSTNLFFVDYDASWAPDLAPKPGPGDWAVARSHPNGATGLTGYWLLSANAETDRVQLAKMGLTRSTPVRLRNIAARGFCVAVGRKAIFVVEPDGEGTAADALRKNGPQVMGASVVVADLDSVQRLVQRTYETSLTRYDGPFGTSFTAPLDEEIGMRIEFHAVGKPARDVCGTAVAPTATTR